MNEAPLQRSADQTPGHHVRRWIVYAIFFASGFAALIYEASWSRLVGLALGHTAEASAIVLSAFFTGMALGQVGRAFFHIRQPLLAFAAAELITAVWACWIPSFLNLVGYSTEAGGPLVSDVWRPFWCFLILLPAAASIGATLPLMIDFLSTEPAGERRASTAYAINTLGGLTGITVATAILLVVVGVRASSYLAACCSVLCGIVGWSCAVATPQIAFVGNATFQPRGSSGGVFWVCLSGVSGFAVMGLEVLCTRMFALVFHNSIYTFGAIVAVFLLALTIGAGTATACRRFESRSLVATSLLISAVTLSLSAFLLPRFTGLGYFTVGQTFGEYLVGATGLLAVTIIPSIACLGVVFPVALRAVAGTNRTSIVAAVNTLAGAGGALVAGFVLPTHFGLWPTIGLFVGFIGMTAVVLLAFTRNRVGAFITAICVAMLAVAAGSSPLSAEPDIEIIQRWESRYGWIDIVRNTRTDAIQLRQNLHYQHGSSATAIREYRQGRLPLALHPSPKEVAFLGLGTGNTAAPAVVDPEVQSAVIVELIPEVVLASRRFSATNLGVVDNPKVEVQIDDARHYLRRSDRSFDVIVSDLYVPWENRTAYLYSVEFYRQARQRLKPGGIFCQWIALYQVGEEDFEMIADSFSAAFPFATLWWGQLDSRYPIVAFIGAERPRAIDPDLVDRRLHSQNHLPGGQDPDLYIAADLADLFLGSWESQPNRRLNTDEHPWLEFTAPLSHRNGKTLHGRIFRDYFDRVLSRLPDRGVFCSGQLEMTFRDVERRRTAQRLSLFGSSADGRLKD